MHEITVIDYFTDYINGEQQEKGKIIRVAANR